MIVRPFTQEDRAQVIELWIRCGLVVAWNDPGADIDRKLRVQPELFLVGIEHDRVIGTAMGGYDGHRGWIYYLAVAPELRTNGYGRRLVEEIAGLLQEQGCAKLNIMVRSGNQEVKSFYRRLGFNEDDVVCLGRRIEQ